LFWAVACCVADVSKKAMTGIALANATVFRRIHALLSPTALDM